MDAIENISRISKNNNISYEKEKLIEGNKKLINLLLSDIYEYQKMIKMKTDKLCELCNGKEGTKGAKTSNNFDSKNDNDKLYSCVYIDVEIEAGKKLVIETYYDARKWYICLNQRRNSINLEQLKDDLNSQKNDPNVEIKNLNVEIDKEHDMLRLYKVEDANASEKVREMIEQAVELAKSRNWQVCSIDV